MHLDCVFSIVSDSVCIMLEEMMGESSPTRRLVDEYTKASGGVEPNRVALPRSSVSVALSKRACCPAQACLLP